ncbi:hypothetical protein Micbo1qcDRAFT_166263 [Microdochium bolleyi]|uniref:Uncharacterized protein n=1 Tax=Microdochium bolleyi TaxID=196109 RepID=A0A136IVN0_9PEZI|nr:hypothetical protein Micbo1qcDRAFT_166263 [Microdochium bolleyi]
MHLLIPHDSSLEPQKQRHSNLFGSIPGELCILSVGLSTEATRLCLALSLPRLVPPLGRVARQQIDGVKRSFRRYKLCLEGSSPITPEIVADIESRSVMKPWDRLAIVANCCKYSTRLNTVSLKQKSHSLSLSILAMCLLNGEIIDNHEDRGAAASADMTTSRWYKEQKFSGFKAPTGCLWPTTFIKSCRFTSVSLQADGIATKGHVWEISGKRITAASFDLTRSHAEEPLVEGHLNDHHRESLGQLVDRLNWGRHHRLANYLDEYLAKEARRRRQATPAEKYMLVMARELATAMVEGKSLRLGRLRSEGDQAPCRAIFITEKQHNFVAFTSFSAAEPITGHHDANDLDCHVSLSVAEDPPILSRQLPRLRVNGWVHSLCFFQGCNPTKVVFPWPKSLLDSEL